jgi:hypothetical protein
LEKRPFAGKTAGREEMCPNKQERLGVDKLPRFCFLALFIPFVRFFPLFYLIPAFLLFILFTVLPIHIYFNGGTEWQRNP